jgi:hypothetical protein
MIIVLKPLSYTIFFFFSQYHLLWIVKKIAYVDNEHRERYYISTHVFNAGISGVVTSQGHTVVGIAS